MAITSSVLTNLPNNGTIKGADTNRSIRHTTDRLKNEEEKKISTQGNGQKQEGGKTEEKIVSRNIQTNKSRSVRAAVTVVF